MKSNKLFDAIGMVKDEYIQDAKKPIPKKTYRSKWLYSGIAAILACAILIGALWGKLWTPAEEEHIPLSDEDFLNNYAIGAAFYPETVPYSNDNWSEWRESIEELTKDYKSMNIDLDHFFSQSIPVFLSGNEGENMVYSPLNVYMALAMLAETTEGNSRAQILDLLGAPGVHRLRQEANAIWKANYRDDGRTACLLANSLWLRDDGFDYREDTVGILSRKYYASVFRGEMGSEDYNKALQIWMNQQTGGLLENQINNLKMTPDTFLAIVSTVWFEASWSDVFNKGFTYTGTFHAPDGDVESAFMSKSDGMSYYWGDRFGAVELYFEDSGRMKIVLPDEGTSAEDLLADSQCMDFVIGQSEWENKKIVLVNLSLPKFDVSSQIDLEEGLKSLGVTDVFDPTVSDFSSIIPEADMAKVEQATHGARVQIDEGGCVATAYTIITDTNGAMTPNEEIDFVVDRPFLFVIYSPSNLPLFVGIVNQPQ